jgi:hypothetical protein
MIKFSEDRRKWNKVSRHHRCPICGKPDWCLTTGPADSPDAVICARIESDKRVGAKGAGWLHRLRDDDGWRDRPRQRRVRIEQSAEPIIDFGAMAAECEAALGPLNRGVLAAELGVSEESLSRLHVGWSARHHAFTFPMAGADCYYRGIRLRSTSGRKWSVRGGREGLFIPSIYDGPSAPFDGPGLLMICEGPTDCAALMDLGFSAVGRPSCTGGTSLLLGLILAEGSFVPREIVIMADDDGPGQRGAWHLAMTLVSYAPAVRVISPPVGVKDARQWKREGAARSDVLDVIDAAPVLQLRYGVSGVTR